MELRIVLKNKSSDLKKRKEKRGNLIHHWTELPDGTKHGFHEIYDTKHHLIERMEFNYGTKHGFHEIFYSSGQVSIRQEYRNGVQDGNYETFWLDGERQMLFTVSNGVLHGPFKEWISSKKLINEGYISKGYYHGLVKYWNSDGRCIESFYSHGCYRGMYDQTDSCFTAAPKNNSPQKIRLLEYSSYFTNDGDEMYVD